MSNNSSWDYLVLVPQLPARNNVLQEESYILKEADAVEHTVAFGDFNSHITISAVKSNDTVTLLLVELSSQNIPVNRYAVMQHTEGHDTLMIEISSLQDAAEEIVKAYLGFFEYSADDFVLMRKQGILRLNAEHFIAVQKWEWNQRCQVTGMVINGFKQVPGTLYLLPIFGSASTEVTEPKVETLADMWESALQEALNNGSN